MIREIANPVTTTDLLRRIGRAAELASHYEEDRDYWQGAVDALQELLSGATGESLSVVKTNITEALSYQRIAEQLETLLPGSLTPGGDCD